MYIYVHTHIWIYIYIYTCIYIYTYLYIYIYVHISVYIYTYLYIHIYIYIHIYVDIYLSIHIISMFSPLLPVFPTIRYFDVTRKSDTLYTTIFKLQSTCLSSISLKYFQISLGQFRDPLRGWLGMAQQWSAMAATTLGSIATGWGPQDSWGALEVAHGWFMLDISIVYEEYNGS